MPLISSPSCARGPDAPGCRRQRRSPGSVGLSRSVPCRYAMRVHIGAILLRLLFLHMAYLYSNPSASTRDPEVCKSVLLSSQGTFKWICDLRANLSNEKTPHSCEDLSLFQLVAPCIDIEVHTTDICHVCNMFAFSLVLHL